MHLRLSGVVLLAALAIPAVATGSRPAWTPVVVALRAKGPAPAARGSEARIAALQRAVLGGLDTTDFRLAARWRGIPGFAGRATAAGLEKLRADPRVARVDPDAGGRAADDESLPLIRGDVVHAQGRVGAGTTVAILDSGIDRTHPDLVGSLVAEHCVVPPAGCPGGVAELDGAGSAQDDNGHGTNVAGIVASAGGVAPIGVAPGAQLVIVKVLAADGSFTAASQVITGLDWLITNHPEVRVVNMSLGTNQQFAGACDTSEAWTIDFAAAIRTLRSRGALVFVSAGNDGSKSTMEAPACIAEADAVGAVYDSSQGTKTLLGCTDTTTAADQVTCFSDSSSALDLLAPGAVITSAGLGGGISTYWGTSQASPHVAGAAAVLFGAVPTATPDQVEFALKSTGQPVIDRLNGRITPRIDLEAALAALTGGALTPKVKALPSTGRRARTAKLRFVAADGGRRVAFRITIRAGKKLVGSFGTRYAPATGGILSMAWKVPRKAPFALTFCVRGTDSLGHGSTQSCASLRISA